MDTLVTNETFHLRRTTRNYCYNIYYSLLLVILVHICDGSQQDLLTLKTDPLTIDLYHKFNVDQEFKLRGSIIVKPKSEYRVAQASILKKQVSLTDEDLQALKDASEKGELYYLKAYLRTKKNKDSSADSVQPEKSSQTLIKSCSLYTANLADFITINLSPVNDFINVNVFSADPECTENIPNNLSREFNTTIIVQSGAVGPSPDTATYIKRLEEERLSKQRDGKPDDRSFFAKYWIYIVPAVIILMMFSGPEQGGR